MPPPSFRRIARRLAVKGGVFSRGRGEVDPSKDAGVRSSTSRRSARHTPGVSGISRSPVLRGALSAIAALLATAVVAPLSFFVVLVLAGPHAGLLPHPLESVVLAAGWTLLLVVPALVARRTWKRLA
jgi:hypothetical protein